MGMCGSLGLQVQRQLRDNLRPPDLKIHWSYSGTKSTANWFKPHKIDVTVQLHCAATNLQSQYSYS